VHRRPFRKPTSITASGCGSTRWERVVRSNGDCFEGCREPDDDYNKASAEITDDGPDTFGTDLVYTKAHTHFFNLPPLYRVRGILPDGRVRGFLADRRLNVVGGWPRTSISRARVFEYSFVHLLVDCVVCRGDMMFFLKINVITFFLLYARMKRANRMK